MLNKLEATLNKLEATYGAAIFGHGYDKIWVNQMWTVVPNILD